MYLSKFILTAPVRLLSFILGEEIETKSCYSFFFIYFEVQIEATKCSILLVVEGLVKPDVFQWEYSC